eukprot:5557952-Prymnesium_polylepis.1
MEQFQTETTKRSASLPVSLGSRAASACRRERPCAANRCSRVVPTRASLRTREKHVGRGKSRPAPARGERGACAKPTPSGGRRLALAALPRGAA